MSDQPSNENPFGDTKAEQILAANNYHPSNLLESDRDALLKSMEDDSIGFAEWLEQGYWKKVYPKDGEPSWHKMSYHPDFTSKKPFTISELYKLYNNQTDKQ